MLPVTITIVNHVQHLEIHVNMANIEGHFSEICSSIRTKTFSALKNVFRVMRFEDIQVEPAFLCPCKCSPSHAATSATSYMGGLTRFAPKQAAGLVRYRRALVNTGWAIFRTDKTALFCFCRGSISITTVSFKSGRVFTGWGQEEL